MTGGRLIIVGQRGVPGRAADVPLGGRRPSEALARGHHGRSGRFVSPLVTGRACSRKEFFDELADNLEARSDRYTHTVRPWHHCSVLKARFSMAFLQAMPCHPDALHLTRRRSMKEKPGGGGEGKPGPGT